MFGKGRTEGLCIYIYINMHVSFPADAKQGWAGLINGRWLVIISV